MRVEVKFENQISEKVSRYQVLVNHKKQGCIIWYDYSEKNNFWQLENDQNKTNYATRDDAVEALCAKNGRKLKPKT